MTKFAPSLRDYGIERIGSLLSKERGLFPAQPGIYVFVAVERIKNYGDWAATTRDGHLAWTRSGGFETSWVEPSEIFYVGVSHDSIRNRLHNYRKEARKGLQWTMFDSAFGDATKHYGTYIIRSAFQQNVPVDVYLRCVTDRLIYVDQLPVSLLAGLEAGLIREFDPKGNRQHRVFRS